MAEALGLAANILAVIQIAAQVAQVSYSYARDVKHAPKVQKQYLTEVSALMEVLLRVEQALEDTETKGLVPNPPALQDDVLTECHASLSILHSELQKGRSRFLQPLHEKEWRRQVDMLRNYRSLFSDFLTSCVVVTGNATYQKVSQLTEERGRGLLLTWLGSSNNSSRQRPSPCPGTGAWFTANPSVKSWMSRDSRLLWCYGPPGVGKTHLASITIDSLLQTGVAPANSIVISFFCQFSAQEEQKTLEILRDLLRQVIEQATGDSLEILRETCKGPTQLQNTKEVAELITRVGSAQPLYIVLDAPDELKDANDLLGHLVAFTQSDTNVLVTSRELPHIKKKMEDAVQLKIDGSAEDLLLYVQARFHDSDFAEEAQDNEKLMDEVVSGTGNLFLLARLTLDDVLELTSVGQIRKALQHREASIEHAFTATMNRIDAQSKARRSLARRLISWITYAKRRLKLDEILHALAVEEDEDAVQPENIPNSDILLRSCLGLVVLDPPDNTVSLVHATAYEFFTSGILPERIAHVDIAKTSLQYLTMNHLAGGPCSTAVELIGRLNTLGFLDYAAKHWGEHMFSEEYEQQLQLPIQQLLCSTELRESAVQALQYPLAQVDDTLAEEVFGSLQTDQTPLHVAAYWGLSYTLTRLISTGSGDISPVDSQKWTPLHWACYRKHLSIAELLLQNGADVNAQDVGGWTPLFWAVLGGSSELTRTLLFHGANHLIRSTSGWTVLH